MKKLIAVFKYSNPGLIAGIVGSLFMILLSIKLQQYITGGAFLVTLIALFQQGLKVLEFEAMEQIAYSQRDILKKSMETIMGELGPERATELLGKNLKEMGLRFTIIEHEMKSECEDENCDCKSEEQ
jgi:hypothetical protein